MFLGQLFRVKPEESKPWQLGISGEKQANKTSGVQRSCKRGKKSSCKNDKGRPGLETVEQYFATFHPE